MSATHLAAVARRQVRGGEDEKTRNWVVVSVIFARQRLSMSSQG